MNGRAGLFVAGTDTEIGKTLVSTALVRLGRQWGIRVAGFKPFSAGFAEGAPNEDVFALHAATGRPEVRLADVGPVQLPAACAPSVAAAQIHRRLSMAPIEDALTRLSVHTDCLVVEGVGGFDVPLTDTWSTADLARVLGLPVLLVVGMRLGCMNHALLTARAVRAEGLPLVGWVANSIDPGMLFSDETFLDLEEVLKHRFNLECLGRIPRLGADCHDPIDFLRADAFRPFLFGS